MISPPGQGAGSGSQVLWSTVAVSSFRVCPHFLSGHLTFFLLPPTFLPVTPTFFHGYPHFSPGHPHFLPWSPSLFSWSLPLSSMVILTFLPVTPSFFHGYPHFFHGFSLSSLRSLLTFLQVSLVSSFLLLVSPCFLVFSFFSLVTINLYILKFRGTHDYHHHF